MFETPFLTACVNGAVQPDAVYDYTEYWHTHNTGNALHEFLGMTPGEYTYFIQHGEEALINILIKHGWKNGHYLK